MPHSHRLLGFLFLGLASLASSAAVVFAQDVLQPRDVRAALAHALERQDAVAIRQAVEDANRLLGDKAGVPETPDQYVPLPKEGRWLTADEAAPGFEPWFAKLEQLRWWKIGLDPTKLGHPLREPAAVVSGNVAACRAKLRGAERSLALAKEAGDFLIWAQEQAGGSVIPFPASRGVSQAAPFKSAERQLKQAEKEGRLDAVIKNGWAINDDGDGGLQFDNAECGVALLELYELTKEPKYLDAAKKSAEWALARSLVPNWNYNSFSVYLLTRKYRVTSEKKYLDAATKKVLLGVIPGQLTAGKYAGRWHDPHNARPAYHYIMLRALAELAIALPKESAERREVVASLALGLKARNKDFFDQGAANKDKAMEALLIVNRAFADDHEFLRTTQSADALDALAKLVSEQARRGGPSLGPREWGLFLEYVAGKK
jgi:hypothetical protein